MIFAPLPHEIEARQFWGGNGEHIARWCGGRLRHRDLDPKQQVIRAGRGRSSLTIRHGQWVLRYPDGSFGAMDHGRFQLVYAPPLEGHRLSLLPAAEAEVDAAARALTATILGGEPSDLNEATDEAMRADARRILAAAQAARTAVSR